MARYFLTLTCIVKRALQLIPCWFTSRTDDITDTPSHIGACPKKLLIQVMDWIRHPKKISLHYALIDSWDSRLQVELGNESRIPNSRHRTNLGDQI